MINVLLATYNGEKYLEAQLDSLLAQSFDDFVIHIRDDMSGDATPQIIADYAQKHPHRICVVPNDTPSGSAKNNFFHLINDHVYEGDYFMFCDQDDVWNPNKVKMTYEKMLKHEYAVGKGVPLLIHTDLSVVNQRLELKAKSFVRFQGLEPRKAKSLQSLLVQNNITGCTVMFNRALLTLARTNHVDGILMHDWWLGLVAAAFGEIHYMDRATMKYRQHGDNQVGAKNVYSPKYISRQIKQKLHNRGKYQSTCTQARAFWEQFRHRLSPEQRVTLKKYLDLPDLRKWGRCTRVIKYRFWMQGFSRRAAQLIFG